MGAALLKASAGESPVRIESGKKLAKMATLGVVDIETPLIANLSDNLHSLFDPIAEGALPIYFGPLLGRLYLEGI